MKLRIFHDSRRGSRKINQDRIAHCASGDALLMLVADGLGGHRHGEVAAEVAAQYVTEAFKHKARPALADAPKFLQNALEGAHFAILRHAADAGLAEVPRTTCVACVVQHETACWAHVGDSRLYHLRQGRIIAQTRDHSRVQQLIDAGRVREEAYGAHPDRHLIYRCLGSAAPPQVEVSVAAELAPGDILLLCSDGLWSPLSARIIGGALQAGDIARNLPALLDEAERRAGGACDNLSVVALAWE